MSLILLVWIAGPESVVAMTTTSDHHSSELLGELAPFLRPVHTFDADENAAVELCVVGVNWPIGPARADAERGRSTSLSAFEV